LSTASAGINVRQAASPRVVYGDHIHDLRHARSLKGDRFRRLTLQRRIDQAIQIHFAIQSLHEDRIGALQLGMSIEQRAHFDRDFRIAAATIESALSVGGAAGKGAGQNQRRGKSASCVESNHIWAFLIHIMEVKRKLLIMVPVQRSPLWRARHEFGRLGKYFMQASPAGANADR
jgi:hypothetical protein